MITDTHALIYYMIHWVISAVSVIITAKLIKGFEVSGFWSALSAAVLIAIANTIIWPILIFLTLPLNVLTLGLFTFVVNGMVIKICAALLPGFNVKTWGAAILGALVLTIVSTLLHYVLV